MKRSTKIMLYVLGAVLLLTIIMVGYIAWTAARYI